MPKQYVNMKLYKSVVESLRKYERKNKLEPNISKTIEHLLEEAWKYQDLLK